MKIIYATDLHGNSRSYERLLKESAKSEADAVLIGGDITPVGFMDVFVQAQRDFLEQGLLPGLRNFKQDTKKPVFIMMGNDDFKINMDILKKGEKQGLLKLLSQKVHSLGEFQIAGYSYINETLFLMKDWEKTEEEIKRDLKALSKKMDPKKSVFVFHIPPFKSKLDMLYNRSHVGSMAVRKFIEEFQPLLTLHGHIHESPEMSGAFLEKIGKTVCINPGNATPALIDLSCPEKAKRLKP